MRFPMGVNGCESLQLITTKVPIKNGPLKNVDSKGLGVRIQSVRFAKLVVDITSEDFTIWRHY